MLVAGPGCATDAPAPPPSPADACAAGDAQVCFNLGTATFKGIGRAQDLDDAERLWPLACDGGEASACMDAGILNSGHAHLADGAHRHPNLSATATWYGRAYDLGEPGGCFGLALLHAHGQGIEQDIVRARTLMEQACTPGHPPACVRAQSGENGSLR